MPYSPNRFALQRKAFCLTAPTVLLYSANRFALQRQPFCFTAPTVLLYSSNRFVSQLQPFCFTAPTVLFRSSNRFVLQLQPFCFTAPIVLNGQFEIALNQLGWKTLNERRRQFVAKLMYKIIHNLAPKSLTKIFHKSNASMKYNLRGSFNKLNLPLPKTEFLKKSLSYRGAKLWNSLPNEIRNKESFFSFNSLISTTSRL